MDQLKGAKLTYFPFHGRAEMIRLAFTVGKIDFEDSRVKGEEWAELKPKTPFGAMPILQLKDGTMISQAIPILRLVGRVAGLYPSDPFEAFTVDEFIEVQGELFEKINAAGRGKEKAEKEADRLECVTKGAGANLLQKIDDYIAKKGQNGFCAGGSLTIADLMGFTTSTMLTTGFYDGVPTDTLDKYKNIQRWRKTVSSVPAIAEYYDSRKDPMEAAFIKARDIVVE